MKTTFIIVTSRNLNNVAEKLRRREGRLLIAGPHIGSDQYYDAASITLYDRPQLSPGMFGINITTNRGTTMRGREAWQTNWEKDRRYLLRLVPDDTGETTLDDARKLFERLRIGPFEIKIGFEFASSQGFDLKSKTVIFIPDGRKPDTAFAHAFDTVTKGLNQAAGRRRDNKFRFLTEHIERMVDYVLQDIVDGKVFKKNVQAGIDADVMTGLTI